MSKAPEVCLYCDKQGNSKAGGPCGFCVAGKPLDSQDDWDNSWGHMFEVFDHTNACRDQQCLASFCVLFREFKNSD